MTATTSARFRRASLGPRVVTSVVGIPLVFLALWGGGLWWAGFAAVVAALGWMELSRLNRFTVVRGLLALGGMAFLFAVSVWGSNFLFGALLVGWLVTIVAGGFIPYFSPYFARRELSGEYWQAVAFGLGPLYVGVPMGVLARWRVEYTAWSVLVFFLVIWANDTAAYFVGLAVGRHKLAPRISPGKSWEGAVAGVVAGGLVGFFTGSLLGMRPVTGLVFGVVTTIASQMGDILESAMKRKAGVKDSGAVLPGHGGILDRFDGILVAAPIAYVMARLWVGSR